MPDAGCWLLESGLKMPPAEGHDAKPEVPQVLTSIQSDGRAISFFGDLHPSFAGNVVKAMASAKQGYPIVSTLLAQVAAAAPQISDHDSILDWVDVSRRRRRSRRLMISAAIVAAALALAVAGMLTWVFTQ